jgi:hypothetical protein
MPDNTLIAMDSITLKKREYIEYLINMSRVMFIVVLSGMLIGCSTPYQKLPADEIFIGAQSPSYDWGMTVNRNFPYQVQPWPGLPSSACPTLNNIIDLTPWVKQEVQYVRPY